MTVTDELCILLVHAHPDDECLSTGGVLARYSAEGIRTVLVIATGGEEGEIVVPELDTPENKARLKEIRDEELACSVQHLGVDALLRLGYRDSGMVDTPANANPASFHQADKEEALRRVVTLIRHHRPQVLVTYDERGGYGHPDHIACHVATVAAFEAAGDATRFPEAGAPWQPLKLYYTAFPRQEIYRAWEIMRERGMPTPLDDPEFDVTRFTTPDDRVTTTVPIHAYLPQKRAAIDCHVTQIRKDSPFLSMPEDIGSELFGVEHFIRVESRVAVPSSAVREDDLFAGLR
ncbi:N-acetyl-1-D-myo-inositol-2-amino-2-deoxy-alpha-D-glucopyranoside deacetylase [Candidatus Gracilibacteria bacterium]|nr:N-acetyl-1-D-myo-inositol-2-amino-2-deoxy-alpha-D-glucopyranoside deacetylase [Candidatus Gracilibacteria bacterium]